MLNPIAGTVPPFMLTDYQNTLPPPKFFGKINDIDCLPAHAQWDKIEFFTKYYFDRMSAIHQ